MAGAFELGDIDIEGNQFSAGPYVPDKLGCMAAVADGTVNYYLAGTGSEAADNLFCQDGNMRAGRCLAFCSQMCLYLGVGRDVVLLVLLLVALRMGTAVSASPWVLERRPSAITGLVKRIHTNSRQIGRINMGNPGLCLLIIASGLAWLLAAFNLLNECNFIAIFLFRTSGTIAPDLHRQRVPVNKRKAELLEKLRFQR